MIAEINNVTRDRRMLDKMHGAYISYEKQGLLDEAQIFERKVWDFFYNFEQFKFLNVNSNKDGGFMTQFSVELKKGKSLKLVQTFLHVSLCMFRHPYLPPSCYS